MCICWRRSALLRERCDVMTELKEMTTITGEKVMVVEEKEKKKLGVMDRILIVICVSVIVFVIAMTVIYCKTGGVPDTLITCVFAICGGECGIMGMIQTSKNRKKERQYELEDRLYNRLLEKMNNEEEEEL